MYTNLGYFRCRDMSLRINNFITNKLAHFFGMIQNSKPLSLIVNKSIRHTRTQNINDGIFNLVGSVNKDNSLLP